MATSTGRENEISDHLALEDLLRGAYFPSQPFGVELQTGDELPVGSLPRPF